MLRNTIRQFSKSSATMSKSLKLSSGYVSSLAIKKLETASMAD